MEPNSFLAIRAAELFPKLSLKCDDEGAEIPFLTLSGEAVEYLGRAGKGVMALSNYRLFIDDEDTFENIPLGTIESIDCRDLLFFYVLCKDGRSVKCNFSTNDRCQEWVKRLSIKIEAVREIEEHFAFAFHAWGLESLDSETLNALSYHQKPPLPSEEVLRMQFDLNGAWRISNANTNYNLCPTYPENLLVPAGVQDECLEAIAKFRIARRLPVVVWRHQGNGAIIARSSQPEVGLLCWRSQEDEGYIGAIRNACVADSPLPASPEFPRNFLIMDARSFSTAVANRARGGGVEYNEYYTNCDIRFMNLPNIHSVRKSFQSLRQLCCLPDASWLSSLESTKWLQHMSGLLSAAVMAAEAVDRDARPVLVHCSDGWDRTPQIVSLASILLDPYYRTVEGFCALVQREWLDFGHKFGDRCGNSVRNVDTNDRCPVFLQFLDCVHQLLRQYPCHFQYSELFLLKLVQHTYSNLFGTFLGNSPQEREKMNIRERTFSVWPFLQDEKFRNLLYQNTQEVLWPSYEISDLHIWHEVFRGPVTALVTPRAPIPDQAFYDVPLRFTAPAPAPVLHRITSPLKVESVVESVDQVDGDASEKRVGRDSETEKSTNGCESDPAANEINSKPERPLANGNGLGGISETDSEMNILYATATTRRMRPARKNRTISEELYDRYVLNNNLTDSVDATPLASWSSSDTLNSSPAFSNGATYNSSEHMPSTQSSSQEAKLRGRIFDVDGLETVMDPVQQRIRSILSESKAREADLQNELYFARLALFQKNCPIEDKEDSRRNSSAASDQNLSLPSDVSWEAVEGKDVETILWVPDHAVSRCTGCASHFWIGRRKHHCRKCGKIYCSDCSEHTAIIPCEDLYYPVRICNGCHSRLDESQTSTVVAEEPAPML